MENGCVRGGSPKGSLRKDLAAGHAEGAATGGMTGLGETYLPAFALAVGLGEITAGLVASVPLLAGGLMQTFSPLAIRRMGSHKRWVLLCVLVQALSFVPLALAAIAGRISAAGILIVAAVYWGSGLATGPAWNTWMGALVPRPLRAHFFAYRTRMTQLAVLAGFVVGGCLLQWASHRDAATYAFALIFLGAGLCRLISFGMLALQREPLPLRVGHPSASIGEVLARICHAGSGQLVLYLVAVQGAVQIAGPFFTPFMFEWLELSYLGYMVLIATAYAAKIAMLPAWGSIAHRLGALRLLWIGGVGIVPVSALWIVSDQFAWLLLAQVLSGVVWGAYELGFFLMFFESIPEEERTGVLTFYNLGNTTAWVLGSTVGGLVLFSLGTGPFGYLLLFGISSVGRAFALLLLKRVPAPRPAAPGVPMPAVEARPIAASIDAPAVRLPDASVNTAPVPASNPALAPELAPSPTLGPATEPAGDLATAS
ncbi:MAG: MFS transporter [Thermoguttaceae bacterium]|jgi:MFS family permease